MLTGKKFNLLMIKIGTEPGLEQIPLRLKASNPHLRIFGVTGHAGQSNYFDEVITTSDVAMLGAHAEHVTHSLFVRPELFEHMSKVEGQLLRLADRVALHDLSEVQHPPFPTPIFRGSMDDRTQLVLRQIAYWDFITNIKSIDAIVFQNYGHIGWDVVLQNIATYKNIPFIFFHEVRPFLGRMFVHDSIQGIGDFSLGENLIRMAQESGEWCSEPSGGLEHMFRQIEPVSRAAHESEVGSTRRLTVKFISRFRQPHTIPKRIRRSTQRRILVRRSIRDEKRSVGPTSFPDKYLFCELQSQPNATTAIKGWMFADQRESIALIAHFLPDDWTLVVKESDRQWSRHLPRRPNFWSQIANIPKVHVVDSKTDTRMALEKASGVIETSYSTLALNALQNGIPLVVLGHTHLSSIPNVWTIKSTSDVERVISGITSGKVIRREQLMAESDLINFARKVQKVTIPGALSSTPKFEDEVKRKAYQRSVETNVAGVISAWLSTISKRSNL